MFSFHVVPRCLSSPSIFRAPTIHVGLTFSQENSHAPTRGRLRPLAVYHSPLLNYRPGIRRRSQSLCSHTHVSHSVCGRLVLQFPTNNQQCLGHVQKTHKERSSHTSTRRPASNLPHSCYHSCHASRASTGARSVPAWG
jgi:hypothetical protein